MQQHSRIVSSGRYRETEVRALVENYAALLNDRDTTARGLRALVAVADVKRVWHRLTPGEQEVILVIVDKIDGTAANYLVGDIHIATFRVTGFRPRTC